MDRIKYYLCREVITPVVTFVFLTGYLIMALQLSPPFERNITTESFYPLIIFILAAPVDIALLIKAIISVRSKIAREEEKTEKPKVSIKPVLVAGLGFLLALGFEPLGFFVTAPIFVFLYMLVYDDKPQQIARKIIFTILIVALVYVLYAIIFDIRFPSFWSW